MALRRLYTDASVNDQIGAWGALWDGPDGEVTVGGHSLSLWSARPQQRYSRYGPVST